MATNSSREVYSLARHIPYVRAMTNRIGGVYRFPFLFRCVLFLSIAASVLAAQDAPQTVQLPNGKLLGEVPGAPSQTNNLPTAIAISPDGRYAVLLHSGYGAYSSG